MYAAPRHDFARRRTSATACCSRKLWMRCPRRDADCRACIQLLFAAVQYREDCTTTPSSCAPQGRRRTEGWQPVAGAEAHQRKTYRQRNTAGFSRQRAGFTGIDRAPHRGSAQEYTRLPVNHFAAAIRTRPRGHDPEELAENEDALRRFVLILWQTRMLRTTKLTVRDEIKNGLEYYRYTFLSEIRRSMPAREPLEAHFGKIPAFRRCCEWAAGSAAIVTATLS